MQQQLSFLEKKIDTLLQQTGPRGGGRERGYSRDSKPYSRDSRDSKPYNRDSKPYSRDSKPYNRDSKPYNRDSKPYGKRGGGERGFRGPNKGGPKKEFRKFDKDSGGRQKSEEGVFIRKNTRGEHYGNRD